MSVQYIFDLVDWQAKYAPQEVSIADWDQSEHSSWSTRELQARIGQYAFTFSNLGIQYGDIVVVCARNSSRVELAIELAAMKMGAIVCPLHIYYREDELKAILDELKPKLIICQNSDILNQFRELFPEKSNTNPAGRNLLFEQMGSSNNESVQNTFPETDPNDCALIMYTSGSSGSPKGVMLSHRNILSNVEGLSACMPIRCRHRVMSYLPRSHVMERTATYFYLWVGASVYFVPSAHQLQEAIHDIQPKWMTAVPLILERLHTYVFQQVEKGKWYERLLFHWSKRSGIQQFIARLLIVNAWKRKFGPGLKGVIVGGAALSPEIAKFFSSSGIRIREGYGLTETSPAITFNQYKRKYNRFGTVGVPLKDVSVRINENQIQDQGVIEVKGPNVMIGYFQNEEATNERMTPDGWFRTGDIGRWVDGKFLQITDRASNVFKNASGRFVAPGHIEQLLVTHPAIDQSMLYGYNRPYNIALIVPDFDWLENWAHQNEIHWTDDAYMIHNPKVIEFYDEVISEMNKYLKSHERIKGHILDKSQWTRENGLVSITLKPRRKVIVKHFEKRIQEVYEIH